MRQKEPKMIPKMRFLLQQNQKTLLEHISEIRCAVLNRSVVSNSYHPMDCSPPGSSMGILQLRILEWVAVPSSRGSSQPRHQTQVSCIAGGFLVTEPLGKPRQAHREVPLSVSDCSSSHETHKAQRWKGMR